MPHAIAAPAPRGESRPLTGRPLHHIAPRYALALLAAAVLSACQRPTVETAASQVPAPSPAAAVSAPAATPVAYTPPSAQSLYQMVAPIALYPDRLVGQVLAASTYPDQVTDAEGWLAHNPGQRGNALVRAVNEQPWDPSVKALTAFPNVLEQLASNLPWTTALGQAYFHDPSDVMNAIQVMRARAASAGTLRSSPKLRVVTASAPLQPPDPAPAPVAPAVPLYAGPAVVVPPPTVIAIEPAEPATVYVPRYDPQVVYGTPVAVYPGYRWGPPAPVWVSAQPAAPSPWLAFGTGVVVGAVAGWAAHSPSWGWNAWNVHWGPPRPPAWVDGAPLPPPAVRPAVVYQGATYVSRSRTVIENIHNVTVNNKNQHYTTVNNNFQPPGPGAAVAPAMAAAALPAAAQAAFAAPQHLAPAMVQPGHAPAVHPAAGMVPPRALPLTTALSPVQHPAPQHELPAPRFQPAAAASPAIGGMAGQPPLVAQERGQRGTEPMGGRLSGLAPSPNQGFAPPAQSARPPAEGHQPLAHDASLQPSQAPQRTQPLQSPVEGIAAASRAHPGSAELAVRERQAYGRQANDRQVQADRGRSPNSYEPHELEPPASRRQQASAAGLPMPQPHAPQALHAAPAQHAPMPSSGAQAPHQAEWPSEHRPQPHTQERPQAVAPHAALGSRHEAPQHEAPRREAQPREGGHPRGHERG